MLLFIKLCLILLDPMECSPPGSSVHGLSQARTLEWVAISFSRGSFPTQGLNAASCVFYVGRQILYHCPLFYKVRHNLRWEKNRVPFERTVLGRLDSVLIQRTNFSPAPCGVIVLGGPTRSTG